MATLLSSITSQARVHLQETTAAFWTDAELLDLQRKAIADLWGAIVDLNQEHFQTIDVTNVSMAANTQTLTGVPTDCFRVSLIEPRDTTSAGSHRAVQFVPRDYNSPEFSRARSQTAQNPANGGVIYYALRTAGYPIAAPSVDVGPQIDTAMTLRFVYVQGLDVVALTSSSTNPIPGESDNAIIWWVVAYARSKEREDRSVDPNALGIYATEKANILTRLTPRQTQEPDIVDGFFADLW